MKSLHIEIFVIKKQWRKSRNFGKEEEEEEDHHHHNNNKAFSPKKKKKKKVALVPTSQVLTGENWWWAGTNMIRGEIFLTANETRQEAAKRPKFNYFQCGWGRGWGEFRRRFAWGEGCILLFFFFLFFHLKLVN